MLRTATLKPSTSNPEFPAIIAKVNRVLKLPGSRVEILKACHMPSFLSAAAWPSRGFPLVKESTVRASTLTHPSLTSIHFLQRQPRVLRPKSLVTNFKTKRIQYSARRSYRLNKSIHRCWATESSQVPRDPSEQLSRESALAHENAKSKPQAKAQSRPADQTSGSPPQTGSLVSGAEDMAFMRIALREAEAAARREEIPVGAVLVVNGKVIATAHNRTEAERDPTAHAEMLCIRSAARKMDGWRLTDATLYVTLEPCPMCAGAVLQARVGRLVWGAPNTLLGADGSWIRLFPGPAQEDAKGASAEGEETQGKPRPNGAQATAGPVHPFHPNIRVDRGVLEDECSAILRDFFRARRKGGSRYAERKPKDNALSKADPATTNSDGDHNKLHVLGMLRRLIAVWMRFVGCFTR